MTIFASGAFFIGAPSADITVTPQRVEPGGTVTVTLACDAFSGAYAESEAFGKVPVSGAAGAAVKVGQEAGKFAVHGRCAADATPLNDTSLVIEGDYPAGGASTGGGSTAARAISPAVSVGVGVLAAGGLLLLVRRARR